jgi:hypothetical protein
MDRLDQRAECLHMGLYILIGLAAVVAILVLVVALQPSAFAVTRSATMNASPVEVFEQVNDFRKWREWSPWERMDPNLQRHYGDPAAGVGGTYGWTGNKQVGEGRMTIVDSKPGELVRIKLEFLKPFQATNTAEFAFGRTGAGTNVTWTMTGEKNFLFKAFGLLMSMDKMVGRDFERGLANLKSTVESVPAA